MAPRISKADRLRLSWEAEMAQGRQDLDRSSLELALRSFAKALQLCETNPSLEPRKYEVIGNIGWVNRLQGRYAAAVEALQQALALADALPGPPTMQRTHIEAELGMVYRLLDRHEDAKKAFERQYEIGKDYEWKRVTCRAIGNLAMTNYQSAVSSLGGATDDDDPAVKKKAKETIKAAIGQLNERIQIADEIYDEEKDEGSHGSYTRTWQALAWKAIALSRLSLCYCVLADLELDSGEKSVWIERAVKAAEEGFQLAPWSAVPLSRLFLGRAMLKAGRPNEALAHFNATTARSGSENIFPTSAIALCMEPSAEHRGYLKEIVDAGVDLLITDPDTGYSALDYVVFADDADAQDIVLEGLRKQLLAAGKSESETEQTIKSHLEEAKLRKGYREVFQEKLRPILLKYSDNSRKGAETQHRHEVIGRLRKIYAETLLADPNTGQMFDHLKAIRYSDFVNFGRLPRSSDGLVRSLAESGTEDGQPEFVIFFSYRWINRDPNRNSPDDAENTQYNRMIEAVESYLEFGCPVEDRDKIYIWMDFACVNQDDPTSGVSALPLIITQCNLVITLKDDQYYERAWCCVEAMMVQTLREEYGVHMWLEHVPLQLEDKGLNLRQHVHPDPRITTVFNSDEQWWDTLVHHYHPVTTDNDDNGGNDDGKKWELREAMEISWASMAEKKLSYESDRPKVMFLERQTELLEKGVVRAELLGDMPE